MEAVSRGQATTGPGVIVVQATTGGREMTGVQAVTVEIAVIAVRGVMAGVRVTGVTNCYSDRKDVTGLALAARMA
jgi:hypothetical protein